MIQFFLIFIFITEAKENQNWTGLKNFEPEKKLEPEHIVKSIKILVKDFDLDN